MDDLRRVIGVFFLVAALLMLSVSGAQAELTTAPVNLYVGGVMLVFGAVMVGLSLRSSQR